MDRYCKKFSNISPFLVKKESCHFEPKNICEPETETRSKKTEKYSHIKDCKKQPREILLVKEQIHCFEPKKTYELEMRTCSKKTKTDSHIKDCKEQPREILPVKKQIYRFEPKKIYELEMKTCPQKTKKDGYIKDCKEQPREIRDQCNIQPLCGTQEKLVRIYETNSFTLPAKEQIYRFEPETIQELEMKTHPKKIKKEVYIKDSKEQSREICDQWEKKNTQPLRDTQERMSRAYKTNKNEGITDPGC